VSSSQLLTEREVSAEYGLTIPWLRKKRFLRNGLTFLKIDRSVRYRRMDIERYLAACVVETHNPAKAPKEMGEAGGER